MVVVTPGQFSFNAGSISPRMRGRVDQNVYSISLAKMVGYLPLLQGPAEAAPGTIFVAAAKEACRALPFEYNITQGYIIEGGNLYLRFFTNDAQIMSGGNPYEIVAPWTYAQIQKLNYEQSFDVMYMAQGDVITQKLSRTGADEFSLSAMSFIKGPWDPRNSDEAVTVTASATTGSGITITASADLFTADDVGGSMEIEAGSFSTTPMWEPGIEVTTGDVRQFGERVYDALDTGRTGTVAPIHVEGSEYDGMGTGEDVNEKGPYGVRWRYLYDRYGIVEFTAYTSATVMTATVIRRIAEPVATWRWRFGAFSNRRGWPTNVALFQDRLCLTKGSTAHLSAAGDYENYAIRNEFGDISRDMAFSVDLPDANEIQWLVADDRLVLGTSQGEHFLAGTVEGVGPGSIQLSKPSENGGAPYRAIRADGRVVFVQRSRKRVLQLAYGESPLYRQESPDLTRYADHIGGKSGMNELFFQKEPERLMWTHRDDGSLAAAAYVPEEFLLGWAERPMASGLQVKSLSKITDPQGRFEQIWMTAQLDASWMILRMAPIRLSGDESLDHCMSDAAVIYDGAATDQISAPHLANKTVEVVADGKNHKDVTLDGAGDGTIDYQASKIYFGLKFEAYIVTHDFEGGSQAGSSQGKLRRIHRVDVRFVSSDGVEVECQGQKKTLSQLQHDSRFDTAFGLVTGDVPFELGGNTQRTGPITIRRVRPKPSTITAIIPYGQVAER